MDTYTFTIQAADKSHQFTVQANSGSALLFEILRRLAYIIRPGFAGDLEQWRLRLFDEAVKMTGAVPLTRKRVARTAVAVADWTWERFAPDERAAYLDSQRAIAFIAAKASADARALDGDLE